MNLNYSGMILAAGFGKRLMPLTKNIPKPLLEINGINLLDNSINFLKKLGCNQIIINSHYHHQKIEKSINLREDKDNITLIYEKEILDTGGGVKNAISHFKNKNLIIINSDIFWRKDNIQDANILIEEYIFEKKPHLLLVEKNNAYGLNKNKGDFILDKNKILRFKKGNKIFYYAGFQIINTDIFFNFIEKIFSFNDVWDFLIHKEKLFGKIMKSNWYHVGDIQGLNIVKQLDY